MINLHRASAAAVRNEGSAVVACCGAICKSARLMLAVCAACIACGTSASFGSSIFDYNVIVTGTFTAESHVQGRTFANDLVSVNNPDFAQSPSAGTGDTLTVAGAISGSPSIIERGVYRYAQASAPSAILNGGSSLVHDASVSIAGLASQMSAASSFYSAMSAIQWSAAASAGTDRAGADFFGWRGFGRAAAKARLSFYDAQFGHAQGRVTNWFSKRLSA